jgi:hypothetical protein
MNDNNVPKYQELRGSPDEEIMMQVRPLCAEDVEAWDSLVEECGTVFHSRRWANTFSSSARLLGLYETDGELVGGAIIGEWKFGICRIFRPVPMTPVSGPFLRHRGQKVVSMADERRRASTALLEYLRHRRPALVMITLSPDFSDTLPFSAAGYKVVPRYTYRLPLAHSESALLAGLSSNRRKNMRSASRDGVEITLNGQTDVVERLVCKSLERQGVAYASKHVRRVLEHFATSTNSFNCIASYNGQPAATAFVIHDRKTAYYLLGGYDPENRHNGAGPLALWSAILHAKALGIQVFDFEGSSVPAVEAYFREFGAELTPVLSVNRAWLPLEMLLKPLRRQFF